MSRIIKAEASTGGVLVRAIGPGDALAPGAVTGTAADRDRAELERRIDDLNADLVLRDGEIARMKAKVSEAYAEGEEAGRHLGKAEAERAVERSLEALRSGVEQALGAFKAEILSLERLAPLLARQALEQVLGDPSRYRELVAATLEHHLRTLDAGAVVRIEVSAFDFSEVDLASLRASLEAEEARILATPKLAPGACRVKLRLGTIDIGVDQQWPALSALLDDAARPEAQP